MSQPADRLPRRIREYLPLPRIMLLVVLMAATLTIRFTPGDPAPAPGWVTGGLLVIAGGLALIAWALWTLDIGMLGGVESLAPKLVTWGPYRWLRHPVYVGMLLALTGYAVAMASWPGAIATAVLVLPAAAFRAKREEDALARRFPAEWRVYRARTGACLPRFRWPS